MLHSLRFRWKSIDCEPNKIDVNQTKLTWIDSSCYTTQNEQKKKRIIFCASIDSTLIWDNFLAASQHRQWGYKARFDNDILCQPIYKMLNNIYPNESTQFQLQAIIFIDFPFHNLSFCLIDRYYATNGQHRQYISKQQLFFLHIHTHTYANLQCTIPFCTTRLSETIQLNRILMIWRNGTVSFWNVKIDRVVICLKWFASAICLNCSSLTESQLS